MSFTRYGLSWPLSAVPTHALVSIQNLSMAWRILLAALSGLMLCAPWLQPSLFWTAWIGWVPVLIALTGAGYLRSFLLGWLTGALCFAGASNWMVDFAVNLKGLSWPVSVSFAVLFWAYVGVATGLGSVLYRWLDGRLPGIEVLTFPAAMLTVLSLYPLLFQTHFAEAQTVFLAGIQGVDLVGAQGMDFIMLMVSALVFSLMMRSGYRPAALSAGALVLAWFGYGLYSLTVWDERIAGWDTRRIGLVQPNDAVSLDVPPPAPGFSREEPEEMVATQSLAKQGAQWIAWPEARYKGYFEMYSVRLAYAEAISQMGVPLIFHDVERRWQQDGRASFNSVAMLNAQGELSGTYRKMQRMPFGEYLPAFFHLPGLKTLSDRFLGEFLRPLTAGVEHAYFQVGDMQVIPKVCYETAFPAFIAEAIAARPAGSMLLFLSQDGWFGETTQPFQHKAMSIIRGVENRVPMVHLINNGPSVATAPSGRVVGETRAFSRAQLLVDVPFAPTAGGSFFTRHPQLFQNLLYTLLGGLVLVALLRSVWLRRARQTTSPAQYPDDQAH